MDLGVGIPRTIRKNERPTACRSMLGPIFGAIRAALQFTAEPAEGTDEDDAYFLELLRRIENDDWTCIVLATQGLRTQTAQSGRGTGLAGLRQTVLDQRRGALHVLSGEAAVTWSQGTVSEATVYPSLPGTVVCLELGGPLDATGVT